MSRIYTHKRKNKYTELLANQDTNRVQPAERVTGKRQIQEAEDRVLDVEEIIAHKVVSFKMLSVLHAKE